MTEKKLTAKQQMFVAEYLVDLNATKAAIRAGYSEKTAAAVGHENLRKPEIAAAVQQAMDARQKRTEITQDRVLLELSRLAFFDIRKLYNADGTLKNPAELDDDAAAALAGVDVVEMQGGGEMDEDGNVKHVPMFTKKAKTFDKKGALDLAMRHLGMLTDRTELTGRGGKDLIPEAKGVLVVPGVMDEASWERMVSSKGGEDAGK